MSGVSLAALSLGIIISCFNGLVTGVEADFQGVTGKSLGYQGLALPDTYLPGVTDFGSADCVEAA